jgi:Collagen triple helix repeat (20 copies)
MFSAIRKRISPTTVVAFMALVFAMTGGAFAASGGGGGGTGAKATASVTPLASAAKAKPKPKAKAGPRGPAGPAGAKGAAGAAGPAGPAGAAGAKGETGAPGAAGAQGGVGAAGKEGAEGQEGSPWTDGGTLPSESTETGVWGGYPNEPTESIHSFPISFPIPLAVAPNEIIVVAEGELTKPGCPGENHGRPTAEPGKLCVYEDVLLEAKGEGFFHGEPAKEAGKYGEFAEGVTTTGTLFKVNCERFCTAEGTWAVTAE